MVPPRGSSPALKQRKELNMFLPLIVVGFVVGVVVGLWIGWSFPDAKNYL